MSISALATLATSSLLGTDRRAPDPAVQTGPVGDLLSRLTETAPDKKLLQTAGILGVCHLAGWKPPEVAQVPPPSQPDVLRHHLPAKLQEALAGILSEGPIRLQAEALQRLSRAGCGLPHRLLPRALEGGKRSTALRPFLLPVLGSRGTWLASQNTAWSYAIGGGSGETVLDDQVWEHGSLDQRKLHLLAVRQQDGARGRKLVADALPQEAARERTAFIECLATGLSLDDQDLLETVLKDKSKEARQAAVTLLSSLPESRFMQRMTQRLLPCLTLEKKFLRDTVITLEAPAAYVAEWKEDLIEEAKPKHSSLGERAWWLLQIVRAVPLAWWETHTSLSPADLIAWAQKSDWKDVLIQGWTAAQGLQKRASWAEAFLALRNGTGGSPDVFDLLETLPLPVREKYFLELLQRTASSAQAQNYSSTSSHVLDRFMAGIPLEVTALSPGFTRQLLHTLKQQIHSGAARYDWQLRNSLVELACLLPAEVLDEAVSGWNLTLEAAQPFAEAVARLGIVVDQRRLLHDLKPLS